MAMMASSALPTYSVNSPCSWENGTWHAHVIKNTHCQRQEENLTRIVRTSFPLNDTDFREQYIYIFFYYSSANDIYSSAIHTLIQVQLHCSYFSFFNLLCKDLCCRLWMFLFLYWAVFVTVFYFPVSFNALIRGGASNLIVFKLYNDLYNVGAIL